MFLRKKSQGFTLLELIIVIIVIGILASIALPRYIRIAEKGRAGEAKNMLSAIRSAQMRYAAQYATYAAAVASLDINLPAAKYFTITASGAGSNMSDETIVVGTATRTGTDNPSLGSYVLSITMGGNITGDAVGNTVI